MPEDVSQGSEGADIGRVDVFANIALVFIALFLLMDETEKSVKPLAEIVVRIEWESDVDIDIDLHAQSPLGNHCWYNGRKVDMITLKDDDTGNNDHYGEEADGRNQEEIEVHVIHNGSYSFNIHSFRGSESPTLVKCIVMTQDGRVLSNRHLEVSHRKQATIVNLHCMDGKVVRQDQKETRWFE